MSRLELKSTNTMETELSADAQEFIPGFAKSSMAVQGAVQDGVHENNEIAVATIPRGWTWHICRQGSAEYFSGF